MRELRFRMTQKRINRVLLRIYLRAIHLRIYLTQILMGKLCEVLAVESVIHAFEIYLAYTVSSIYEKNVTDSPLNIPVLILECI